MLGVKKVSILDFWVEILRGVLFWVCVKKAALGGEPLFLMLIYMYRYFSIGYIQTEFSFF